MLKKDPVAFQHLPAPDAGIPFTVRATVLRER
jgi:hypothetical protein